jgi:hypothetical protein
MRTANRLCYGRGVLAMKGGCGRWLDVRGRIYIWDTLTHQGRCGISAQIVGRIALIPEDGSAFIDS